MCVCMRVCVNACVLTRGKQTNKHTTKQAVLRPFVASAAQPQGQGGGGTVDGGGMVQVQTVDFFKTFSPGFDPYLFGQIAGAYVSVHACCVCENTWPCSHHTNQTKPNQTKSIDPRTNPEQRTTRSRTATP